MRLTMTHPHLRGAVAQSFLSGLPSALLDQLLAAGRHVELPAGAMLYRAGDESRAFLVVAGLLRVYMSSPEGRHVTVRYARAGDVLGIPVLVGGPVHVNVATLDDSSLLQ